MKTSKIASQIKRFVHIFFAVTDQNTPGFFFRQALRIMLEKQEVYVNETAFAKLRFFVRDDQRFYHFELSSNTSVGGIEIGELTQGQRVHEIVGNTGYNVTDFSMPLMAMQTGTLTLGPISAKAGITVPPKNTPFYNYTHDPFLRHFQSLNGDETNVFLQTEKISIQVLPSTNGISMIHSLHQLTKGAATAPRTNSFSGLDYAKLDSLAKAESSKPVWEKGRKVFVWPRKLMSLPLNTSMQYRDTDYYVTVALENILGDREPFIWIKKKDIWIVSRLWEPGAKQFGVVDLDTPLPVLEAWGEKIDNMIGHELIAPTRDGDKVSYQMIYMDLYTRDRKQASSPEPITVQLGEKEKTITVYFLGHFNKFTPDEANRLLLEARKVY